MQLSEYIQGLQKFLEKHGDMPSFYASDPEGNSYQPVTYTGSEMFTKDPESWNPDMYCREDIESNGHDGEDVTPICVIN